MCDFQNSSTQSVYSFVEFDLLGPRKHRIHSMMNATQGEVLPGLSPRRLDERAHEPLPLSVGS